MNRDQIYNHLVEILTGTFELDAAEIRPESELFTELDLDSIDMVDIFVEIHALTGKRIDAEAARSIRTVADIVDLVLRELATDASEAS